MCTIKLNNNKIINVMKGQAIKSELVKKLNDEKKLSDYKIEDCDMDLEEYTEQLLIYKRELLEDYNMRHMIMQKEDFLDWLELHNIEDDEYIMCNDLMITRESLFFNIDEGEVVKLEESEISYDSVEDQYNIIDCFQRNFNIQLM